MIIKVPENEKAIILQVMLEEKPGYLLNLNLPQEKNKFQLIEIKNDIYLLSPYTNISVKKKTLHIYFIFYNTSIFPDLKKF